MKIQEILDQKFASYDDAIKRYGKEKLLIAVTSQLPINKSVPETENFVYIKLELVRHGDGWRFVNMGEV